MAKYPDTSHWTDVACGELVDKSAASRFRAEFDTESGPLSRTKYLGYIIGGISLLALSCVSSSLILWLMLTRIIA